MRPGDRDRETVSPPEAARILGVSPGTVRNYFDAGLLEGERLYGRHRRIYLDSVLAMKAENRDRPPKRGPGGRPPGQAA